MSHTRFEWDPAKDCSSGAKHWLSFQEEFELFSSRVACLEIYDEAHSVREDRFIAVGPIRLGVIAMVYMER